MRLIALPWIIKTSHKLTFIRKITRPVTVTPRKASLLVTWAMCWYVLTTIILVILHAQT